MPKLPRLKSKELINILTQLGFEKVRHKGTSHIILRHTDGRRTTIPFHGGNANIPIGTLRAIIRDVDISSDELVRLK